MRKNILKKNEDAILDLTEPKIWASSGNYVLNHILSGKFSRGYPAGRITQLFGDSGSGKSFLTAKAIAEAQKNGYMVAVLDSEQAVSQDYLEKIGVNTNPDMLMTVQVHTVEQAQDMLLEVLEGVKTEQAALGNKHELKLMLIVDSLGALTSEKALENAEKGHHAADMGTKAKALTNMFNQVVQKIGLTDTVCIMTNHGALEVAVMFPQLKPKGGQCLTAGTQIQTQYGLKPIEDVVVGDMVKTHMDRFKPVEKLFEFDDLDVLEIELDNGQTITMTPEHKMLVERHGIKQWVEARDLTTSDCLLELVDTVSVDFNQQVINSTAA
jgi:recombination protein RecA